ncbi:DUF664 domain-containing protein [Microlunatus speluncae]|uniref:mycothiol transferase n=1 Tax=Microlunatus speluncae TaxID=2594267 RepID=UPI001C2DB670|nr:DUF664 domain-containing protein [Microlunatus speluncae]
MNHMDLYPFAEDMDGSEAAVLCFALDRARWRFAWKTGGLDADQLRRRHPPSAMTLAGLIKHLTAVEDGFAAGAAGRPPAVAGGEGDWVTAVADAPEALYAGWYGAVERARNEWRALSADDGLDVRVPGGTETWVLNRRGLLVTLLEEYQVHAGHADLIREAVDGLVGNDPPGPDAVSDA